MLVLFAHIELTPEMKWLARNLALSPGNSDIHERFVSLHRMYGIVTLVELVLVVALSVLLLTWRTRRGSRRRTKDAADLQMLTQEPH